MRMTVALEIGGWMHTAHLTQDDIVPLVGNGSDFTRSNRRAVLRDVLQHSGKPIPPATYNPIRRQQKPKRRAKQRWTAEHLSHFRCMFPDSTPEGTALNITLFAMPTWHGLQQFGWKDLSRIAIPGSYVHAYLKRKLQHIPNTALSFMQHSLTTALQANTTSLWYVTHSRIQHACLEAGVPQLTSSGLSHSNAQIIASLMVPQKVNSPIFARNCSSV